LIACVTPLSGLNFSMTIFCQLAGHWQERESLNLEDIHCVQWRTPEKCSEGIFLNYESGGQEFESLRARHSGTKLGTAKPAVFCAGCAEADIFSRDACESPREYIARVLL
jgi:hypothetical protein